MFKTLAFIGLLGILAAIGAGVYFFGGHYSVAATAEEPAIVKWLLIKVRQASVERNATDKPPVSLDDPAVVQAGARAYSERGCVHCHGAPGVNWSKFSEGLKPDPPDLKQGRQRTHARAAVLGDQERHQHDRHAELRDDQRARPGNLEHRRVREEVAERIGRGLQGLERAVQHRPLPVAATGRCRRGDATVT